MKGTRQIILDSLLIYARPPSSRPPSSIKTVEDRVCKIFKIEAKDIYSKSREKVKASARGLFCYWAVRELGYGLTELARHLGITQPAVGYAVKRGEHIGNQNHYKLEI